MEYILTRIINICKGGAPRIEICVLSAGVIAMLRTIALILLVLWLLGFISLGHVIGSFIHLLIVVAVVLFLIDLLSGGRRVV